ncbi:hypothetical protein, partial [Lactobacillus amylolyticus]
MKKHFIQLGRIGLIYYCWLFIILFIGLVFAYEGTEKVNWISIIITVVFFLILGYILCNSYYEKDLLKLPYRSKIKQPISVITVWTWKAMRIEKIKVNKMQIIYLFRIERKKVSGKKLISR